MINIIIIIILMVVLLQTGYITPSIEIDICK